MEPQKPIATKENTRAYRRKGAADLCRTFMENEGWAQLFQIARGEACKGWVKTAFGTKQGVLAPDFNERLAAFRLVTSYGYGRPAERADPDTGRSVTDLLIQALVDKQRGPTVDEERVR